MVLLNFDDLDPRQDTLFLNRHTLFLNHQQVPGRQGLHCQRAPNGLQVPLILQVASGHQVLRGQQLPLHRLEVFLRYRTHHSAYQAIINRNQPTKLQSRLLSRG